MVFDEVIPMGMVFDEVIPMVFDEVIPISDGKKLFRWEGSRQHDRTHTKIASPLENFPATVIMLSAWPD